MNVISFYLPRKIHNRVERGNHPFYSRLIELLTAVDVKVSVKEPVDVLADPTEHSLHHDCIVEGDNSLTVWSTPLDRFWQVSRGENPIRRAVFDKKTLHKGKAEDFFYSLLDQEIEEPENLYPIDNYILAVLQEKPRQKHAGQWCSGVKMIERTLKFDSEKQLVIWTPPEIKLNEKDHTALDIFRDNERITLSTADQSRVLTSCAYVVTQSHPVGFLANLYRKPVVMFGETAFGQAAQNIFAEERPRRSFNRVETARVEYEKFVFWYLSENSIDTRGQKNHRKMLDHFRSLGWDL